MEQKNHELTFDEDALGLDWDALEACAFLTSVASRSRRLSLIARLQDTTDRPVFVMNFGTGSNMSRRKAWFETFIRRSMKRFAFCKAAKAYDVCQSSPIYWFYQMIE
jgi:hypothetical protein